MAKQLECGDCDFIGGGGARAGVGRTDACFAVESAGTHARPRGKFYQTGFSLHRLDGKTNQQRLVGGYFDLASGAGCVLARHVDAVVV